jgi:hypothetical protein
MLGRLRAQIAGTALESWTGGQYFNGLHARRSRSKDNHLLAALPPAERARLYPRLQLVPMPLGMVLYESGDTQTHVYFPTDSIISLRYVMPDGTSEETSVVSIRAMATDRSPGVAGSASDRRLCRIGAWCTRALGNRASN